MGASVAVPVSTLAAAVVAGCAAAGPAGRSPSPAPGWSLSDGWLTAPGVCRPLAGPAVNLRLAGSGDLLRPESCRPDRVVQDPAGGWEAVYERAAGVLADRYRPFPELGPAAWQRSIRYTNTSGEAQDLVGLELSVAPEPAPGGSAWAPRTFRMREVSEGRSLCMAYWEAVEGAELSDSEAALTAHVGVAWRLGPGETAEVGYQGLWVGSGAGPDAFREEARRWFAAHGFREAVRYPRWLREAILYELSAGGHVDSRFSDVGGFDALSHQVAYLADLGISAVWLNAVQRHKTPPDPVRGGWNHYEPRDFLQVDPILGGEEGFRRLLGAFRRAGIRVVSEIVPHGGRAAQAEALPQWWTRERDGSLRRNWSGFGMDNAAPEWQDVLRRSMAMVSSLGRVDGARIDVADGQGPNWGSPRTGRASFSTLGAGLEVLAAVRDGIRAGGCPLPVLIPESVEHPVYFGVPGAAVLGYGWGLTMGVANLSGRVLLDAAELNRRLYAELERERGALPPGALVLRTLNNHDTVCDKGRVQQRFGAGLHRALYGVCLAVPGVPMLYQEEEVGAYDALRRLHAARRAVPWLADGEVRYLPPEYFDPRVFAVWRTAGKRRALCLVNLSGETVSGAAELPVPGRVRLTDAVSGAATQADAGGRFAWVLPPYGTAFLVTGDTPRPRLPPERFPGESAPAAGAPPGDAAPAVTVGEDGIRVRHGGIEISLALGGEARAFQVPGEGCGEWVSESGSLAVRPGAAGLEATCSLRPGAGPLAVRVEGADRWAVSGRTGLLLDRFVRRHFPFSEGTGYRWERTHVWGRAPWGGLYRGVAPCGRLWQSILEPLHPALPALGFSEAAGRGLVLSGVRTDAMNIVLTDTSDEGPAAPPRLEVRFLAVDEDLHPDVQRFGPQPFWRGEGLPPPPPRPLSVRFVLAPASESLSECLAVEALARESAGPEEMREGDGFSELGGRVFLIKPGRITWSGLPPVDATCSLELELRLSERSAAETDLAGAYRVRLDGVELPLTWGRTGVWSTGNAYFALARTPPVDLRGRPHTLVVETLHTWCALRPSVTLVASAPGG